jgi:hypothetical protein
MGGCVGAPDLFFQVPRHDLVGPPGPDLGGIILCAMGGATSLLAAARHRVRQRGRSAVPPVWRPKSERESWIRAERPGPALPNLWRHWNAELQWLQWQRLAVRRPADSHVLRLRRPTLVILYDLFRRRARLLVRGPLRPRPSAIAAIRPACLRRSHPDRYFPG